VFWNRFRRNRLAVAAWYSGGDPSGGALADWLALRSAELDLLNQFRTRRAGICAYRRAGVMCSPGSSSVPGSLSVGRWRAGSITVGSLIGALAGFYGRLTGALIRFTDEMLTVPTFFLAHWYWQSSDQASRTSPRDRFTAGWSSRG
jgi:hypothetical protein